MMEKNAPRGTRTGFTTGACSAAAAQLIGISERSFWYRLKKLGIHVDKIVR